MASRRITQETFDNVVRENMIEFEMEPEEALNEAIQQFESQGVDLVNVVKTVQNFTAEGSDPKHHVLQALDSLQKALDLLALDEMGDHLTNFTEQCSLDFAHRHLAAEKSAYATVLSSCRALMSDGPGLLKGVQALAALLDGQPDLLDLGGKQLLLEILKQYRDHSILNAATIRAIRYSCLKHEQNRQDLVQCGVLPLLTGAVVNHGTSADVVREAACALRVMTYDDDIRVPFGHAHDHAKMIVMENDGLRIIIEAAKAFTENPAVLSELCATLSRLAVRNEFCQDIVDLGGLNFMIALLADCIEHRELVKQVLGAFRAIAGNDEVKDAIISAGGTDLVVLAMNRHMGSPQICEQACAALGMFALRKPENCRVIMEGGGALMALQAMKSHPAEVNVQKQACGLLRNLMARNPDFSQLILEMGGEVLIRQAKDTHQDCDDLAKAALRDLGCKVEFQELWTGQKGTAMATPPPLVRGTLHVPTGKPNFQVTTARAVGTVIPPPLVRGGQQGTSKLGSQQNPQIVMPPLVRGAQQIHTIRPHASTAPPPLLLAPRASVPSAVQIQGQRVLQQGLIRVANVPNTSLLVNIPQASSTMKASSLNSAQSNASGNTVTSVVNSNDSPASRQAAAKLALRKQLEKTLLEIPPPKPPAPELNFLPSAANNEFIYLVGLEEVVHNLLETQGKTSAQALAQEPYACSQCKTDFTCRWRQGKSGTIMCEQCITSNQKKALKAEHTNRLKAAFVKALQQEQEIEQRILQQTPSTIQSKQDSAVPHHTVKQSSGQLSRGPQTTTARGVLHTFSQSSQLQNASLISRQGKHAERVGGKGNTTTWRKQIPNSGVTMAYVSPNLSGHKTSSTVDRQREYLLDMIPSRSISQSATIWK